MVRIVSDTSTLYNSAQAREVGFAVSPLSVTIAGNAYKEFDEISASDFVALIRQGNMPTSSQPAIGDVAELYNSYPGDEILNISMADGLSGTYNSAVAAAGLCENPARVQVLNTRTLCGPHRYLVEKAVQWAADGLNMEQLLQRLEEKMTTEKSFLLPADFEYLRRGGRLSPLVSYVGQAANLTPVMTLTEDGRRLTIAGIRRGFAHGFKYVAKALQKHGVGAGWKVYITHADAPETAKLARKIVGDAIPDADYEILPLSPAFITQGGPGCVAVQVIEG